MLDFTFEKMDSNKSGTITKNELFTYYKDQQPVDTDVSEEVGVP